MKALRTLAVAAVCISCAQFAVADTMILKDGTTINNCFVRDEGIKLQVWEKMGDVGTPNWKVIPRPLVKDIKVDRDDSWDAHPALPDLSVTFIEMTPYLQSLHGSVNYDQWGRAIPGGHGLPDLGEEGALHPEEIVKDLKLNYKPGEQITLTAHIKNVGFASAKPFDYVWLIDGKEISKGRCKKPLKEMDEVAFPIKWNWQEGQHTATFKITTEQPEIATINNELDDPLWGWSYAFVVTRGRLDAWHAVRSAYGTFCFEDYYRWHVDIMNKLFADSVYPSAPEGIKARVRLGRIIYCDNIEDGTKQLNDAKGVSLVGGAWSWQSDEDKNKKWDIPAKPGRISTEWSLPHELGHQLGLTDLYCLDYGGHEYHVWPDNGEKVAHFQTHPITMMHWHGPQVFSEICAGYLNQTWDKPRGYFGDYYFGLPKENFLRIVDVNGRGVPDAKVEVFQSGTVVDPNGQPGEDQGVKYFPVIEDGDFGHPVSKDPVIVGTTDQDGIIRLANRPVKEVKTLGGYHRVANPFGNNNVVGNRDIMFVRVTKFDRPCYYCLEIYDFLTAVMRGQKDKFTMVLKTPYGSVDSPPLPRNVAVTPIDETHVKVSWSEPDLAKTRTYLDRTIGFKVYRRVSSDCINDRPWFEVATLGPDATEFVVDLKQRPEDVYWFGQTNRFAVATLGELSVESELVEVLIAPTKK